MIRRRFSSWTAIVASSAGLALGIVVGAASEQPNNRQTDTQVTIRQLESELNRSVVTADVAVFDRLLGEDFTHTSHTGRFRSKQDWLKDVRPGKSLYSAYGVDDQSIRVYGETAVVTGRITPQGTNSQGEPIGGRYRYVRVWVLHDGRWSAVAFQGTQILEK